MNFNPTSPSFTSIAPSSIQSLEYHDDGFIRVFNTLAEVILAPWYDLFDHANFVDGTLDRRRTYDEIICGRRIVRVHRKRAGAPFDAATAYISCIFRRDTGQYVFTSPDALKVAQFLCDQTFSSRQKKRLRRNLDRLNPTTITRNQLFFNYVMALDNPKPTTSRKIFKVFSWDYLSNALHIIYEKRGIAPPEWVVYSTHLSWGGSRDIHATSYIPEEVSYTLPPTHGIMVPTSRNVSSSSSLSTNGSSNEQSSSWSHEITASILPQRLGPFSSTSMSTQPQMDSYLWDHGSPTIIFPDTINRIHPLPTVSPWGSLNSLDTSLHPFVGISPPGLHLSSSRMTATTFQLCGEPSMELFPRESNFGPLPGYVDPTLYPWHRPDPPSSVIVPREFRLAPSTPPPMLPPVQSSSELGYYTYSTNSAESGDMAN